MKNGQVQKQRPWVRFITTLFDHTLRSSLQYRAKENCKVCWRSWQTGTVRRVTPLMAFFMYLTKILCYSSQNGKALGYLEVSIADDTNCGFSDIRPTGETFWRNLQMRRRRKEVRIYVEVYFIIWYRPTSRRELNVHAWHKYPDCHARAFERHSRDKVCRIRLLWRKEARLQNPSLLTNAWQWSQAPIYFSLFCFCVILQWGRSHFLGRQRKF